MKKPAKRYLAVLLALVLVSGLVLPAHGADYVYNWGVRGQDATFLTESAVAFYEQSSVSYEMMAQLDGASDLDEVSASPLYAALQSLMTENHTYINNYEDVKSFCRYTDCQGGSGPISSFYSGISTGPAWDGTWNREHTWPNSKGLNGSDEDDIMMLRPTTTTENSGRGNTAYGESAGFYDPNKESGGTYNLHGDVARIALYVYTRWGNTAYMWGAPGVIESKDVLLKWMQEDPVDTWELGRNDAVQSITGTRNVFVDYPELAFLLFGEQIPATMTTPSGKAGNVYTITATAQDETMGTVSVSGNNINAQPAAGFAVVGYEILEGAATVRRSGNSFVVTAFSDCTIAVIFAAKSAVKLTLVGDGNVLAQLDALTDEEVNLPQYTADVPDGYTFLGWCAEEVIHSKKPPVIYLPGESYTVSADQTLYALFTYVGTGGPDDGIWTKVTDAQELSAGDRVILAAAKGEKTVVCGAISGAYLTEVFTTFSEDMATIPTLPEDAQVFTLGGSEGAWTLSNGDGQLLGATAVKKLAYNKGTTTWSISFLDENVIIQNATASYGRFLYNASSPRFTTYTSNTNVNMLLPQLYVLDTAAGSVYYTTEQPKVLLGDVNDDGSITVLDLMRLANYFAKGTAINAANADVNGDGNVTVLDLMRFANYFAGKATLG